MPSTSFNYSKETLNSMVRTNVTMLINLSAACFVFLFFIFLPLHSELIFKTVFYIFILIMISFMFFAQQRLLIDKIKKQRVVLTHDEIQRHDGRYIETLRYPSIQAVKVIEEPNGEIQSLYLQTNHGIMRFHGLDRMKIMLELLEPKVNKLVLIKRKRLRISRQNLWVLNFLLLSIAVVFIGVYYFLEEVLFWIYPLLWVAQGFYLLLKRPFSIYYGFRYYKWEILGSILLMGLSTWLMIQR